jgi:dihydrodipicolinate synthase/N-acetylneuraminate lyase
VSRPPFGRGVHPVLSMPFDEHEDVDEAALVGEVDWLVGHGVDGVVLAMVSELLRLEEAERRSVGKLLCDAAGRRVPVVLSVGAETTRAAVAFAEHAQGVGASAVMAVPPVTVALPDDEILAYFTAIAAAVEVPLVVQDASGYVGRPLPLDLYRALLDRCGPDRVLFKPEAVPIGPRLSALRELSGGSAQVFEGTGGLALVDSHRRGVVGTMPGAEVPWALVALWRALERGDADRADAIHWPLAALVTLQTSLDSFVATEKHLLVRQGVFGSARRRRPCGPDLDPATRLEVDRLYDRLRAAVRDLA